MLTVHHLENSRSQRILWLLEELGLTYEVKRYERDRATMLAPPALREIHPTGKSPVLTDGAATIAESGAIVEYLLEIHGGGRLRPATGTPEWLQYIQWLHYAEGSAMPPLVMKLVVSRVPKAPMPALVAPFLRPMARRVAQGLERGFIDRQLKTHIGFMEATLARQPWFAGPEFTAADIMMSFPAEAASARGGGALPNLQRFIATIHARPAWQRALERGGPYALLR